MTSDTQKADDVVHDAINDVKDATHDAKNKAEDAAHDVKNDVKDAAHDVKNKAKDAAHDAKNKAKDAAQQAAPQYVMVPDDVGQRPVLPPRRPAAGAAAEVLYDPANPGSGCSPIGSRRGPDVIMKYGRDDELQADQVGVRIMADAGYDPRSMATVMQKLGEANQGPSAPEFMSTHPNPEDRIEQINQAIAEEFANGVSQGLIP